MAGSAAAAATVVVVVGAAGVVVATTTTTAGATSTVTLAKWHSPGINASGWTSSSSVGSEQMSYWNELGLEPAAGVRRACPRCTTAMPVVGRGLDLQRRRVDAHVRVGNVVGQYVNRDRRVVRSSDRTVVHRGRRTRRRRRRGRRGRFDDQRVFDDRAGRRVAGDTDVKTGADGEVGAGGERRALDGDRPGQRHRQ